MGKWLESRGCRDKIVLATKFGMDMGDGKVGLSPNMMRAVEDSLRRLKTDYIDLYQSHKDDEDTPVDATLEAYAKLIEQGKVREIGASNFSASRLKEALDASKTKGLPRYQSLQPLYSLVERDTFEGDLENLCEAEECRCHWFLFAGERFPDRQVPIESRYGGADPGAACREIRDRRRVPGPRCLGRGGAET